MRQREPYNETLTDEKNTKVSNDKYDEDEIPIGLLDIYSEDNPYSLVNLVPARIVNQVASVPESLREMSAEELRDVVKPDKTLNQLRLKFWYEYDRTLGGKTRKMSIMSICGGICSVSFFMRTMANREKAAWITTPITSYELGVEELMETVLSKLRKKVDEIEITTSKDLNTLLKIYETFDKRVHGEYRQNKKIEISTGESKKAIDNFKSSEDLTKYIEQNNLQDEIIKED